MAEYKDKKGVFSFQRSFNNISQLVNSDSSFNQIAQQILNELAHSLDCQWGTYWQVSSEFQLLKSIAIWVAPGFTAPNLSRNTESRILSLGEGTAGQVWKSKEPIWTRNLIQDMCLPRSLDADSSGLTGGFWFALKTKDTVYAVIELLGRNLAPPSQALIVGIESFSIHLGYILKERSGAESNLSVKTSPRGDSKNVEIGYEGNDGEF